MKTIGNRRITKIVIWQLVSLGILISLGQAVAQASSEPFIFQGELEIGFTNQFVWVWNDQGSGADGNMTIWRPVAQPNFYSVGDILATNYDALDEDSRGRVAFTVRDLSGNALAAPTSYEQIWGDYGSGGNHDGSIWAPTCPSGYVALGHVGSSGYDAPSTDAVRCLRQDLAARGVIGTAWITSDQGSGGNDDMSAWPIFPTSSPQGRAYLSAGTFYAHSSYDKPGNSVYVLQLDVDVNEPAAAQWPSTPSLTSANPPSGDNCNTTVSELPWFAVKDEQFTDAQKMVQSPIYTVAVEDCWAAAYFLHNTGNDNVEISREVTEGFSTTATQEFSNTTTLEVSVTAGSEAYGVESTVSLSNAFTFGSSSSQERSQETKETISVTVPSNTAFAIFQLERTYELARGDGSRVVNSVSGTVPQSTITSQFP